MSPTRTLARWVSLPLLCGASIAIGADGEIQQVCNCNQGGGTVMSAAPMTSSMPAMSSGVPMISAPPMMLPPPMDAGLTVGAVGPPPGTLGRTYSLPTKLVPAEKHPRIGMLDVRATAEDVIVSDTKEFREEDDIKGFQDEMDPSIWHFETKPLYPGVPHVYKVELVNGGAVTDVRYVRLIRGRIIELAF
ncbi:MAG: hypothetical protein ACK5Q5_22990 [Planctomycetaceae bacterium]